jgi:signal recognition particle subunit SRP54
MIRPAAVEQLKTLGQQNNIPVYFEPSGRPVKICERGIAKAQEQGSDVVILDTQGRLHIDREMMDELKEIREKIKPNQVYLVVDAMTGQDAVKSADEFNKQLGLRRRHQDEARRRRPGGAALPVKAVTASRSSSWASARRRALRSSIPSVDGRLILGMGDVVSSSRRRERRSTSRPWNSRRRSKDELTIEDRKQLQSLAGDGPISALMKMLPRGPQRWPARQRGRSQHAEAINGLTVQEKQNRRS